MRIRNAFEEIVLLALYSIACSKRSDSGERCEVKKAMKSRGRLSPSLACIFSRSFLLRTAPHYLNAWNRLSILSNDKIVSALRPGLTKGVDFRG